MSVTKARRFMQMLPSGNRNRALWKWHAEECAEGAGRALIKTKALRGRPLCIPDRIGREALLCYVQLMAKTPEQLREQRGEAQRATQEYRAKEQAERAKAAKLRAERLAREAAAPIKSGKK